MRRLQIRSIKLMPDDQCFRSGGARASRRWVDIDPRDLALSDELVKALNDWAAAFDSILNWGRPSEL